MSETNAELERVYTVPLSRAWIAPRHRRTKRAVNILKEFAEKHMKSSEIKIDTDLNERLWDRGITSPPRRITVKMSKDEDGVVTITLPKEKKGPDHEEEDKGTVEEPSEKIEESLKGKESEEQKKKQEEMSTPTTATPGPTTQSSSSKPAKTSKPRKKGSK
jgi:large subunit ribosomal protein L31e